MTRDVRTACSRVWLIASLLLSVPVLHAGAQTAAPNSAGVGPRVIYSIGGGFAEAPPFGGSGANIGYSGNAAVDVRTPLQSIRLRTEASLSRWSQITQFGSLTTGLVATLPVRFRAQPYVISGAGVFKMARVSELSAGWTLGAGLRIPLSRGALAVESRIHNFQSSESVRQQLGIGISDHRNSPWQVTYTPLLVRIEF